MAKVVVLPRQGGKTTTVLMEYDRLLTEGEYPIIVVPNVRRQAELQVLAPYAHITHLYNLRDAISAHAHALLIFDDVEWCLSSHFNRSVAMITATAPDERARDDAIGDAILELVFSDRRLLRLYHADPVVRASITNSRCIGLTPIQAMVELAVSMTEQKTSIQQSYIGHMQRCVGPHITITSPTSPAASPARPSSEDPSQTTQP